MKKMLWLWPCVSQDKFTPDTETEHKREKREAAEWELELEKWADGEEMETQKHSWVLCWKSQYFKKMGSIQMIMKE